MQSSDLRSRFDTVPSSYNFGSFARGGTLFKEHRMKENKKLQRAFYCSSQQILLIHSCRNLCCIPNPELKSSGNI